MAILNFDAAIRLDPDNPLVYYARGEAYGWLGESLGEPEGPFREGSYRRAIQDYDKAIEIYPEFDSAYRNRAYAYEYLDRYQMAIENHDKFIQLWPDDANAYNDRGHAYYCLGDYHRAVQDFDTVIQLTRTEEEATVRAPWGLSHDPAPEAYYARGEAYSKLGQDMNAKDDLAKSGFLERGEDLVSCPTLPWNRRLSYRDMDPR